MRKKMAELKELVSEAEDVYRQTVAAKRHVTHRMADCFDSLQNIHDCLHDLSGPNPTAVLSKLKVNVNRGYINTPTISTLAKKLMLCYFIMFSK